MSSEQLVTEEKKGFKQLFLNKRVAVVLLMLIPIGISLMGFETTRRIWGFIPAGTQQVSIQPDLISTAAAIALYLAIIVRFRIKLFSDGFETLMAALNILFCASFLSLFLGEVEWLIFSIDSTAFLLIAIIFSWVGMRSVAGFVWIILFFLSLTRVQLINEAMGLWGVAYVLAAFLSIALQMGDSIYKISDIKEDFMGAGAKIGGDLNASANTAINASLNLAGPAVATGAKLVKNATKK